MPMKPLKWFGSSLLGHVVAFEIFWSLPLFSLFLYRSYSDWTVDWAVDSAFWCALAGAGCAAILWYAVTAPRIRRRRERT
jgi:hypothetical protein